MAAVVDPLDPPPSATEVERMLADALARLRAAASL
jgi:hypothetical protein